MYNICALSLSRAHQHSHTASTITVSQNGEKPSTIRKRNLRSHRNCEYLKNVVVRALHSQILFKKFVIVFACGLLNFGLGGWIVWIWVPWWFNAHTYTIHIQTLAHASRHTIYTHTHTIHCISIFVWQAHRKCFMCVALSVRFWCCCRKLCLGTPLSTCLSAIGEVCNARSIRCSHDEMESTPRSGERKK